MMRPKLSRFLITSLMLAIGGLGSEMPAQDVKKVGTSAAAFLQIPVGVRGTAMGSAFVAVADDPSAMYWNPGGIARLSRFALYVDHAPWLPGLTFNFVGLVLPVGSAGSIGLNVTALTTEEMLVTTIDQPMGTGETFSASSVAVGVTYARNLTDRFSIGANIKMVHESILNSSATGFMFDIGTLYDMPFPGIRLGVSIANFGTGLRIDGDDLNVRVDIAPDQQGNNQSIVGRLRTDDFDAPLYIRVGLSWDALKTANNRLTLAMDGLNPNDNAQSVNLGAEYALFDETLFLRGGFNDLFLPDREKGLTLGLGVHLPIAGDVQFRGGYAFQDFAHLDAVNRFTLELRF